MAYDFEVRDVPAQPALFIRHTCKQAELGLVMAKLFPEVGARIKAIGAQVAGMPFCRYTSWRDQDCDIEAGMTVAAPAQGTDRVVAGQLGGVSAACTVHTGPYEGLQDAHSAAAQWVVDNGKEVAGGPWEVYANDPGQVKDPKLFKTEIYWPIK